MFKSLLRKWGPNPLDHLLVKAKKKGQVRFLLFWNRGLGDIALGLYAIVHRIRTHIPEAEITFLTRPNLQDGFTLLGGVNVLVAPDLKRGAVVNVEHLLHSLNVSPNTFDVIIKNPDPTHWVKWQLSKLTPILHWQKDWDILCEKYCLDPKETYVGVHVQTETQYAHWRNWPLESWQALFEKIATTNKKILLFGFAKNPVFSLPNMIDLRGETPLFDLLSVIKNRCSTLIVPDSGVASMVYFLQESFPLKIISLWADPHMGILKQNVPSPNPLLVHIPLIGENKNITTISAEQVYAHIHSGQL